MNDGRHDFDFVFGTWHVAHRRLRERLTGCTDWEAFEGTGTARPILGGIGNFDEIVMHRASGVGHGATLRLFNPETREWSIHWASAGGMLFPPMIGRFRNGRGEFYAHEPEGGRHVYSRFIWSEITGDSARWEQALSDDGGETWETNWIMEFTRQE